MMEPRYRDITSGQIPDVELDQGVKVKVVCGEIDGTAGPVRDIVIDPGYLDVRIPAGAEFRHDVPAGYTAFAYVLNGSGYCDPGKKKQVTANQLVIFGDGDELVCSAGKVDMQFLLVSGKPIHEPVAWYGPVVMNTQAELEQAFKEIQEGTFLKHRI